MGDARPNQSPDPAEYQDKDLPDATTTEKGAYTGSDVPGGGNGVPDDDGEYTDTDVVSEHRAEPPEGSYTDTDTDPI